VNRIRKIAPLGLALLLSACMGKLLGGGKPDNLYRLETALNAPAQQAPDTASRRAIIFLPIDFAAEVRNDRILVSRGAETLYLKDARWVSPAPDMLAGLARTAFAARAPEILVTTPRQSAGVDYALQLSVDRFEAVYAPGAGKKDPPIVRVEGEARLFLMSDRSIVATRRFKAEALAQNNRLTAIVSAFSAATDQYLVQLVEWTSRSAVISVCLRCSVRDVQNSNPS
jgi:cholesterol transport system auxiliary component